MCFVVLLMATKDHGAENVLNVLKQIITFIEYYMSVDNYKHFHNMFVCFIRMFTACLHCVVISQLFVQAYQLYFNLSNIEMFILCQNVV